ncbi:hypothetical protein SAMN05216553_101393 [Lentzea fradiae]|uniref:Small secreted domain n=1 Tax=Lentzea fradiae TaxID=200378 RepID=A0A1G7KNU7_9PSEU|nr:hypothetical protein [Lentzea fradiae]SDF38892.1 hypothetical protein SAMN05216553_101393 [Lentzea fradiae]
MLKKALAAVAVGTGFLMVGSPAFATQGGPVDELADLASKYEHNHQVGLVNMENSQLLSDINLCHLDVNVLAVPVLSANDSGTCLNQDVEVDHHEHHHADHDGHHDGHEAQGGHEAHEGDEDHEDR